ncbi:helix-turn-helix domain-containing protein, partial [Megamonas funiformis]|uniref:helix-turn-helix domain-containing protein n=1 Tax=Megamonas funiformis TaxID=437897 RepID=UPI00195EB032
PIFKQKVIEYKWLHHLSLNQTAAKFSIPNTGTISTWEKLYSSYGFSGLVSKKRGRPSRGQEGKIAKNILNRNFKAEKPNEKWATDVTEFALYNE